MLAGLCPQAVHAALRRHFNIQEPLLLRLLGHLLVAHSVHFLAQHCKDGFEQELGIPQLRGPGVLPAAEAQWHAARQSRVLPLPGGTAAFVGLPHMYVHRTAAYTSLHLLLMGLGNLHVFLVVVGEIGQVVGSAGFSCWQACVAAT
jgi:hypothetical protein